MSETLPLTPTGNERLDELLRNGTILPNQCYDEGKRLDVFAAAAYVGCAKGTIYRAELREKLETEPRRSRKLPRVGNIRTYDVSELQDLRDEIRS